MNKIKITTFEKGEYKLLPGISILDQNSVPRLRKALVWDMASPIFNPSTSTCKTKSVNSGKTNFDPPLTPVELAIFIF